MPTQATTAEARLDIPDGIIRLIDAETGQPRLYYTDALPQGDPVPVTQPGRPPMSQRATDHAGLVLAYSAGALPVGAATSLVLWSLAHVSPEVLAVAALAPIGLVTAVGVTARMIGRAVREGASGMPDMVVHQYAGPTSVQQIAVHSDSRWWGKTVNQLPGGEQ